MTKLKGVTMSLFFAGSVFYASAQTHYASNVSIGVKGGADFSQVFFSPSVKQKLQPGINGGIMVRYIEESHFGLIAELSYAQRGWAENFEEAPFNYSRTLNYIELPIFAHIFFGNRGRFFFNAGPQISYFLKDKVTANFDPEKMSEIPDFPYVNRMTDQMLLKVNQKFDYGISAGIGGEFNINNKNSIMVEARFYYGLGNVFSATRKDVFNSSNQMTLSASLGYWFRIK